MAYKFHNNAIITGCLNSFCLACNSLFKCEQDAEAHIRMPAHKQKLNKIPYSDKFQGEYIRKFKEGYFCEFCNIMLPIASKVNLHIAEEGHKQNKGVLLLKSEDNDVIAFNNILIKENAWHGFMETVCSVCDTEFEDETDHKNDRAHSLNLILKPVKFGGSAAIYRQIDESAIQCLTCNTLVVPSTMSEHFNSDEHKKLYSQHEIASNDANAQNDTTKDSNYNNDNDNENKESGNKIDETKRGIIDKNGKEDKIDEDLSKSNDRYSNGEEAQNKPLQDTDGTRDLYDGNCSDSHSDSDSYATIPCEDSDDSDEFLKSIAKREAIDFAKENDLSYEEETGKSFCRLCKVKLPSSLKSMKEHVEGAPHQKLSSLNAQAVSRFSSGPGNKVPMKMFVDNVYHIRNPLEFDSVVNCDYCITWHSFWLISMNVRTRQLRCMLCETTLSPHVKIEDHVKGNNHGRAMPKINVVSSLPREFIREIRQGLYHCGFCNLVVSGWSDMENHLESSEHRARRLHADFKLGRHLNTIREHKMERDMEFLKFLWFLDKLH